MGVGKHLNYKGEILAHISAEFPMSLSISLLFPGKKWIQIPIQKRSKMGQEENLLKFLGAMKRYLVQNAQLFAVTFPPPKREDTFCIF